jgi:hypothetical protein
MDLSEIEMLICLELFDGLKNNFMIVQSIKMAFQDSVRSPKSSAPLQGLFRSPVFSIMSSSTI